MTPTDHTPPTPQAEERAHELAERWWNAGKLSHLFIESDEAELASALRAAEERGRSERKEASAPLEIKMRVFSPDDEYLITINECPVGGVLSRRDAEVVVDWMRGALAELTIAFA